MIRSFVRFLPDIERVCQELANFEGGKIDLDKNEETGIAIMTINNPTRKNSFTGKFRSIDLLDQKLSMLNFKKRKNQTILILTSRLITKGTMMVQLRHVLTELEQWTTGKALIIYGAGNF